MKHRIFGIAAGLTAALFLAGCAGAPSLAPAVRPLSKETIMLLGKKGMEPSAPIFVRIFKEESELEVWKQRSDGRFHHFKTYPICTWSGDLGPKQKQGDKQAPEGFYTVNNWQMNPNSQFHLAFNLGYPNAYDKARGRTGSALMVHGKCRSAGCYAMTDALIEEIYALAREPFGAGVKAFQVHAMPFRMTDANMARHKGSQWYRFWTRLKEGYDHFEATQQPPEVIVCNRRYHVNVEAAGSDGARIDAMARCPRLQKLPITPIVRPLDQQVAETRIMAPGLKRRSFAAADGTSNSTSSGGLLSILKGSAFGQAGRGPGNVGFGLTGSAN